MMLIGTATFDNESFCNIQGFVLQISALATQSWCTVVGANLLLQMMFYWTDKKCRAMMKWWHALVLAFSGLMTVLPAGISGFAPAGVWCWIPGTFPELRMGTFYGPMWSLFGINIVVMFFIHRRLHQLLGAIPKEDVNKEATEMRYRWVVKQTLLFVIVGMGIWVPGTVSRIWQMTGGVVPEGVTFIQILFTPAQGVFNVLLYTAPQLAQLYCVKRQGTGTPFEDEDLPMPKSPAVFKFFDSSDSPHHPHPRIKRVEEQQSPRNPNSGETKAEVELTAVTIEGADEAEESPKENNGTNFTI